MQRTDRWPFRDGRGHPIRGDVVDRFRDYGLAAVVYTDISRDGMQTGVNVEATKRLAQMTDIP